MIIAIETATTICSVALIKDEKTIGLLESDETNSHSKILHILIDRLLKDAGTDISSVKAIAISKGPGSYTGLRIGVSAAKGLCYAKDIPLIGINTLQSMAYGMRERALSEGIIPEHKHPYFIPMIDARRMEVFTAVYDKDLNAVKETSAEIITPETIDTWRKSVNASDYVLILGGDGAAKCKEVLPPTKDTIVYLDSFEASAGYMLEPAIKAFKEQQFEDTAYFEPFYLKDFIAGKPRGKGLD